MEGEISNFIVIWCAIFACLCYCHTIAKFMPKGTTRLLTILPVICLFFFLPFNLTSIYLGILTSFFISWLANFKLLLFAFGQGPLSSNPPIPLSHFISLTCLPIQFSFKPTKKGLKSPLNYATKAILLVTIFKAYQYKQHLNQNFLLFLLTCQLYVTLEFVLAISGGMAKVFLTGAKFEEQFDEPYISTSLHDFWGRRWNIMVSKILRQAVYVPVRSISKRFLGRNLALYPAILATFIVSGIMHETLHYHMLGANKSRPSWEMTCYFLIHGVCLDLEIGLKRAFKGKFSLPPTVSRLLTMAFVFATSIWLFVPPFLRAELDVRSCTESLAFIEFVKHQRLVKSSTNSIWYLNSECLISSTVCLRKVIAARIVF